jgi:dihydrofolate reductase
MTNVRLFTATSVDGFVADSEGDSTWLEKYRTSIFLETGFLDQIGAVILGRRTYEVMQAFDEWPYHGKLAFILASQTLNNLPMGACAVSGGIAAGVQAARERMSKDIWIVGGAVTMESALEAELVDIIEVCLVPTLIGCGLSMFNSLARHESLALETIETYSDGLVKLRYLVDR